MCYVMKSEWLIIADAHGFEQLKTRDYALGDPRYDKYAFTDEEKEWIKGMARRNKTWGIEPLLNEVCHHYRRTFQEADLAKKRSLKAESPLYALVAKEKDCKDAARREITASYYIIADRQKNLVAAFEKIEDELNAVVKTHLELLFPQLAGPREDLMRDIRTKSNSRKRVQRHNQRKRHNQRRVVVMDMKLAFAVAKNLGKPTPAEENATEFLETHLPEMTSLDARGYGISNLAGIEHASALTDLDLGPLLGVEMRTNPIADISALSTLTALERLDLSHTRILNVEPLSTLTALERLDLSHTHVFCIDALDKLTGVKSLLLDSIPITDINALSGMVDLETLSLRATGVRELSSLAGCTALRELDVSFSPITDLTPLEELPNLERVVWDEFEITDIAEYNRAMKIFDDCADLWE